MFSPQERNHSARSRKAQKLALLYWGVSAGPSRHSRRACAQASGPARFPLVASWITWQSQQSQSSARLYEY